MTTSSFSSPGEAPWELFDRYFSGELSLDEQARMAAWMAANPGAEGQVDDARLLWEQSAASVPVDVEHALERLERQMAANQVRKPAVFRPGHTQMPSRRVGWIGILCIAVAITIPVSSYWMRADSSAPASRSIVHSTTTGQRTNFILPDGSQLVLGPRSTVRYSETFGQGTREITLRGEAVFTVSHRGVMPFVVNAGSHSARVLGTTFFVRYYDVDSSMHVAVAEGKIAVGTAILSAGDLGEATSRGVAVTRQDVSPYFAWTTGRLVFENTSLDVMLETLERWYGVRMQVADVGQVPPRYTVTFDNESTDSVVAVLELLMNARAKRAPNGITFYPAENR